MPVVRLGGRVELSKQFVADERSLSANASPVLSAIPARGLDGMRIPEEFRAPLDAGRLALLSTFPATVRRSDRHTAAARNRLIAHLCDEMIVPYASPGGSVEALVGELAAAGRVITRP